MHIAAKSNSESLARALEDNAYLVGLIAGLTGDSADRVREKLVHEHHNPGAAVHKALRELRIEPYVWSDKLVEFYQQTDAFLYETLVWNRTLMKNQMRVFMASFLAAYCPGPQRIITFGDGLSIDSLFLAEAGHSVDYYEVSQRCIRFAQSLGDRVGRQLSIVTSADDIATESYDLAVCLDVLEHLPEPPQVVAQLASYLRPGGRLIVHAPFWHIQPNVSTHLKSNLRYSGNIDILYGAHGLRPIAGQFFWNPIVLEKVAPGVALTPVSSRVRATLICGGLLLKCARVTRLPHLLVLRWMLRNDQRRLRTMAADLAASAET